MNLYDMPSPSLVGKSFKAYLPDQLSCWTPIFDHLPLMLGSTGPLFNVDIENLPRQVFTSSFSSGRSPPPPSFWIMDKSFFYPALKNQGTIVLIASVFRWILYHNQNAPQCIIIALHFSSQALCWAVAED